MNENNIAGVIPEWQKTKARTLPFYECPMNMKKQARNMLSYSNMAVLLNVESNIQSGIYQAKQIPFGIVFAGECPCGSKYQSKSEELFCPNCKAKLIDSLSKPNRRIAITTLTNIEK